MTLIDVTAPARASAFLEALSQRVLLSDGAMGTALIERGVPGDACLEKVNLDRPALVRSLHLDYIEAGADFVQTNTFGANRSRLAAFGLEGRVVEINRRAVQIAREAMALAGRTVFLAGDVGPLDGSLPTNEAREAFEEQIGALVEAGVDFLLLETFSSLDEAVLAVESAVAVAPGVPVVAEISFLQNRKTSEGLGPEEAARRLQEAGADVIGANCGDGPAQILRVLHEMAKVPGVRLIAQPNAGQPLLVQRRVVYSATAEYLVDYAQRFIETGARIVGGCCGTSARHIAAIRRHLDGERGPQIEVKAPVRPSRETHGAPRTLEEKLNAGQFVLSVELDPPRGVSLNRVIQAATLMKDAGVDCINVGDSPMAEVRLSAIAMAALIKDRVGIDPIVHCSSRDRNLMALQADLMGAHAFGLRNVLCIKGDPHALGSYGKATAVWDVNAIGLMRVLSGLNAGHDAINHPVRPSTSFFIGAALNPSAADLDSELRTLKHKVEAGARFIISQAVFEAETLERLLERLGPDHPPILLGVWPIHSSRQASFLHESVVPIPESVRETMRKAGNGGEEAGTELAQRLLEKVQPLVQGVYFIPSFGRFSSIARLVVDARERQPDS